MSSLTRITVEVQGDHIQRQTRAKPVQALAELIWNALDGDAKNVVVEFGRGDLAGGFTKIAIYDDGDGFSHAHANEYFAALGGSWKRQTRQTKSGREVHGQEGRGRYKALALGDMATWQVCYEEDGKHYAYDIKMEASDLRGVQISAPVLVNGRPTGVTMVIENPLRDFKSLSDEAGIQQLTEVFAIYLINYQMVSIVVDGQSLDPDTVIEDEREYTLEPLTDDAGQEHDVVLHLIEWKKPCERRLYLCTEQGFPLEQSNAKFQVGDYFFSAYLKSSYLSRLHNEGQLAFSDNDEVLRGAIEASRAKIKDVFRERQAERARTVVDEWKEEKIYPFEGESNSVVETAERQVFDIVAVSLQTYSPDLESAPVKSRALHLAMLRSAIERSPGDLQQILGEVLQLPSRKRKELADLLKHTTLSAIITAAKTVSDRLKFLDGLEQIVLEPERKEHLKERTQLHKILERNTWLFGEEYNLWVSDKGLKKVLERCRDYLDPNIIIDEPVKIIGKKVGIVDLMFSRQMRRHKQDDVENLVVELKRPSVTLGSEDVIQIEKYAQAVAADERFARLNGVRWYFWLVGNDFDDYVASRIKGGPDPTRHIFHRDNDITIGVKTWGEIIEENRARLQYFQEHLQHNADDNEALKFLKERHAEFLEGVTDDVEIDESS